MSTPLDLQDFINQLDLANELARVKCNVDPYLEVAAVIDKVCKSPDTNKAILFEDIKGSSIPLAANLFGSMKRMAIALGVETIDQLLDKVEQELTQHKGMPSENVLKKLVQERKAIESNNDDQAGRTECRLSDLPALHCWPGDGGKYLTLAQVYTRLPGSTQQNCGMYRIQLVDDESALLRCHPGSGGEKHLRAWHELGEPMPLAISLGGSPALTWAAGVSLPDDVEEMDFVSWLTGQQVAMSRCTTTDLMVPATSEFIIEGMIHQDDEFLEGPFGNHTGHYSKQSPAPVIRVRSVTRKQDAIYPCTIVGPPPMENVYLALTTHKLFQPLLKHDCPWVEDVHFPVESIYHRIAFVQLTPECDIAVDKVKEELTKSLFLKGSKKIVLFDADVDMSNLKDTYWNFINKVANEQVSDSRLIDARTRHGKICVKQSSNVIDLINKRSDDYGL